MTNQVTIPLYNELIGDFPEFNTGTEPVQQVRKKSFEQFKKLGFPTRRVEDWKYTNVVPFLQEQYHVDGKEAAAPLAAGLLKEATIPKLDCYQLVLVNSQLQISEDGLPSFIKVRTLEEAQKDSAFAEYFTKNPTLDQYHFAALNTAFFSNGLFIEIDAKAALDKPLHIVHAFTGNGNLFVQPRHLIVVRRQAELSIIESVVSASNSAKIFVNSLTEVFVEENAVFDQYLLQTASSGTRLVNHTEVSQKRHSVYNNYTFSLPSADLIRNNLNLSLDDSETESHMFGLYLGAGNQLLDNHTLVNHKMPHCNSNEIYKGVLTGNATGVFNGKIFVQEDAQKTNAFQQNNNLLLSNKATINSKPQLEIFADDVKCSHGSTVGQLSSEALFYLRSRGISEQSAKALLVNAFAFDVTEKIKIPALEAHVNKLIKAHVPTNEGLNHAE